MMNNRKGFTFIELIIVIIIIGIISLIGAAVIGNIVNNSKTNVFIKNEKLFVNAAKSYLSSGKANFPSNVGDSKEIKYSDLKTNGYIDAIKNPNDRSQECDGYVMVTKIANDEFNYTPHLDCENGIGSLSEDGLVAHYTFDDYQESTTNLLSSPLNFTWSAWANASAAWAISVQSMKSDYYDIDGQMRKYTITAGSTAGGSNAQSSSTSYSITSGKKYSISFYVKGLVGRKINVSIIQNGTPYASYVTSSIDFNVTTEWQRFEGTYTSTATATDARVQINMGYDLYNDELYIYKPQLEENGPTAFVNGTRNAIVKDYSGLGNDATLQLNTTPKWINTNMIGNGAYQFDGINDYIDFGAISENILRQGMENNNFTLSAWIKTTGNQDATSRIIIARPGWHDGLQMSSDNRVYFGMYDENSTFKSISSSNLSFNVKHYVAGVYNNKVMYLYVDGVLVGSNSFFSDNPTIRFKAITSSFATGAASSGTNYQFRGIIDDIRIYNRALNAEEILQNYNTNS